MRNWPICFCSLLLVAGLAGAGESSCDDPGVRAEWRALAAKYAAYPDWQALHALWLGLCAKVARGDLSEEAAGRLKVARGDLSEEAAGRLFERERARVKARKQADPLPAVESYLHPQG